MKKGILLVNLGTPTAPEAKPVRVYLSRFLADQRVIDTPRFLWWPILHGIILRFRPRHSAALYKKIWSAEGSPLLLYTQQQTQQLQELLPNYVVRFAMCYSAPSVPTALSELANQGVDELTVIPLYPQYSGTTTGSVFDQVMTYFQNSSNIPQLYFQQSFFHEPLYIAALANQIKLELKNQSYDQLIFSYHGIPQKYADNGDPYPQQCTETTQQIMQLVGDQPYQQSYQSKFGPSQWLLPATDQTLKNLASNGCKSVLVITPSFVADCLETLQEINRENRQYFMESGGQRFTYLHPLNGSTDFTAILAKLAVNNERVQQTH
ncbi:MULTISPECIES: ferrochelatase [Loigolactobacillus]|uniref:Coproporphyrin III ferrochelatase n=1 Tax=Loigolactobacillus backii TaxID=375175 RepID=A0A192H0F9_9LACO|nr:MULTISPECIES: ferrochelatase [Loigolactobacillus]ANK61768.1 ferrochelatase [Loigolactobacillus backii]ANK65617.1 ferrochelatase [Loigolactobacillus backii]ANK68091.1 ferrochelatase [Loigolactobacillus backii]ANK69038.1 ferrochelatase [Loigolactobacillus backii]MDA5387199.1 ferrochelatase [Loigolactobacillus backii]